MRKDAFSAYLLAQGFYIMVHLFVILIFYLYPNDIANSCTENDISCLYFPTLKISASILYFFTRRKPGFLSRSKILQEIELSSEEDWEIPKQGYCDVCNIIQPYRSRHCKKCEECVAKFDHHCFWIGSCIGELNHFRFCLYLALESAAIDWAAYNCLSGLSEDQEAYGAFIVALIISGLFGILTTGLCIFHIYLVSSGYTTWEFVKRDSINYFKIYPSSFHPFDLGVIQNWKAAIFDKEIRQWTLPRPMPVYPFNWCDNEYWSCC
ncbi:unnamed protein product [Blepharisma stoltei]|uniref:Palmitoyltransferase n=1 Tax=Blepharisma stoltei TaxID=1481888 RepID=A0AAU9JN34_9CILI|nr:unnamed protein product [Blepharisma stoltei]